MTAEKLEIGAESRPRFEFRTFGHDFPEQAHRLARLSEPVPEKVWERTSDEIYIMARPSDANNTKIRDGKMDIKTLVGVEQGLEQWNPLLKAEFPLKPEVLTNAVLPAFGIKGLATTAGPLSLDAFLELIDAEPDLQAVRVHKQRFGYMVHGAICEMARVRINGASVTTLAVESTEIEDILRTLRDVGLEGFENINYLQAIKRVIGWIPRELAN